MGAKKPVYKERKCHETNSDNHQYYVWRREAILYTWPLACCRSF